MTALTSECRRTWACTPDDGVVEHFEYDYCRSGHGGVRASLDEAWAEWACLVWRTRKLSTARVHRCLRCGEIVRQTTLTRGERSDLCIGLYHDGVYEEIVIDRELFFATKEYGAMPQHQPYRMGDTLVLSAALRADGRYGFVLNHTKTRKIESVTMTRAELDATSDGPALLKHFGLDSQ